MAEQAQQEAQQEAPKPAQEAKPQPEPKPSASTDELAALKAELAALKSAKQAPAVDAQAFAAMQAQLEQLKTTSEAAKGSARLNAILSRLPSFLPAEAKSVIGRGLAAQLGAFAVDLGTLDAMDPAPIVAAIEAAKLSTFAPPAAAAQHAAPQAQAQPLTPPAATIGAVQQQKTGRVDGWYHKKPESPTETGVAALAAALLKQQQPAAK